jgi:hypothetical protein
MPKIFSAANAALRALPARTIAHALADAAERWSDYALDTLFGGITAAALTAVAGAELGSLEALDGFVERDGRPAAWARGVDAVTIVSSDTTIGVAIPALVFALLAKCTVTVKDRSDALVAAFAETLTEELPELGAAIDVRGRCDVRAVRPSRERRIRERARTRRTGAGRGDRARRAALRRRRLPLAAHPIRATRGR